MRIFDVSLGISTIRGDLPPPRSSSARNYFVLPSHRSPQPFSAVDSVLQHQSKHSRSGGDGPAWSRFTYRARVRKTACGSPLERARVLGWMGLAAFLSATAALPGKGAGGNHNPASEPSQAVVTSSWQCWIRATAGWTGVGWDASSICAVPFEAFPPGTLITSAFKGDPFFGSTSVPNSGASRPMPTPTGWLPTSLFGGGSSIIDHRFSSSRTRASSVRCATCPPPDWTQ
jgi:hypothetical protein